MVKELDKNYSILITGSAGFIGANLVKRLIKEIDHGHIIGLDNLNSYYDVALKKYRLSLIDKEVEIKDGKVRHTFIQGDIGDSSVVRNIFHEYKPDIVINLAAQGGVRHSIDNPDTYIKSNVIGFYNILEACRHSYDEGVKGVNHLIFASSSSVYGGNTKIPFSTSDPVDHPVSLYAATKKSDELFAYCYSKLYAIPTTGLRFFTVYGPAGRPDMAYFKFADKLRRGEKIQLFNYGNCRRDFTYIDDIVEGIVRVMKSPPALRGEGELLSEPPYAIYNIGDGRPENILDFVRILSEELIRVEVLPASFCLEDHLEMVPMQAGDVTVTYADCSDLERDFDFSPTIDLRTGMRKFAEWYVEYCKF